MRNKLLLIFIFISLINSIDAGPYACAACITASAAACVVTCAPLVLPQAVLICALECEMTAAYGPCAVICTAPTP